MTQKEILEKKLTREPLFNTITLSKYEESDNNIAKTELPMIEKYVSKLHIF